jgi:hypothetical protein
MMQANDNLPNMLDHVVNDATGLIIWDIVGSYVNGLV